MADPENSDEMPPKSTAALQKDAMNGWKHS